MSTDAGGVILLRGAYGTLDRDAVGCGALGGGSSSSWGCAFTEADADTGAGGGGMPRASTRFGARGDSGRGVDTDGEPDVDGRDGGDAARGGAPNARAGDRAPARDGDSARCWLPGRASGELVGGVK